MISFIKISIKIYTCAMISLAILSLIYQIVGLIKWIFKMMPLLPYLIPYFLSKVLYSGKSCKDCSFFIKGEERGACLIKNSRSCSKESICLKWKDRDVQTEEERILSRGW